MISYGICLSLSELLLNSYFDDVYLASVYSVPGTGQSAWLMLSLMYTSLKVRSRTPSPLTVKENEVQRSQIPC